MLHGVVGLGPQLGLDGIEHGADVLEVPGPEVCNETANVGPFRAFAARSSVAAGVPGQDGRRRPVVGPGVQMVAGPPTGGGQAEGSARGVGEFDQSDGQAGLRGVAGERAVDDPDISFQFFGQGDVGGVVGVLALERLRDRDHSRTV